MSTKSSEQREFEKLWKFASIFGEACSIEGKPGNMTRPSNFVLNNGAPATLQVFWPLSITGPMYNEQLGVKDE